MAEKDGKDPASETPEERFKRLATLRVNNALDKIRLIGNLSGPSYRYSEDQARKIIEELKIAIGEVESKLGKTVKKESKFFL